MTAGAVFTRPNARENRIEKPAIAGDYLSADTTFQTALRIERAARSPWAIHILFALAGLAVDQGEYRRADSLYRRTIEESSSYPGVLYPETCPYWGGLLTDLGRRADTATLAHADCKVGARVVPSSPVPVHVDVKGISPNQLERRLDWPYTEGGGRNSYDHDDVAVLWRELGAPATIRPCLQCRMTRTSLATPESGALFQLPISDSANGTRHQQLFLLFEAGATVGGIVRDWRVTPFTGAGPSDNTDATTNAAHVEQLGGTRWLVARLSEVQDDGGDGPVEPTYRATRERWYALSDHDAHLALTLPVAGYETAFQLGLRLGDASYDRPTPPAGPGRAVSIHKLPHRLETNTPVLEVQLTDTIRAGTGRTRSTERVLFVLHHRMTFVWSATDSAFQVDPARSDLSATDFARLYTIPSTALGYDDVLRLAFPQLLALVRGPDARNAAWVHRLASLASDSEQRRALLMPPVR